MPSVELTGRSGPDYKAVRIQDERASMSEATSLLQAASKREKCKNGPRIAVFIAIATIFATGVATWSIRRHATAPITSVPVGIEPVSCFFLVSRARER